MLLKQSEIFGIAVFGDGATITTIPMTNVLASNVHEHQSLLGIIDSTGHMAKGKIKDAPYLARQMLPHMRDIDPDKSVIDLVTFDGAKNIQNAGQILSTIYPRITVTHGAEHSCTLFFTDIFKHPTLNRTIKFAKKLRNIFGSTRHFHGSLFKKVSREHNKGRLVTFIKPSECRMAGEIISILRVHRLGDVLKNTCTCPAFVQVGEFTDVSLLLLRDSFWDFLFKLCRAFYAQMRIIRLADQKTGAMDKLMYYVLQADSMLEKYLPEVETAWTDFHTGRVEEIMTSPNTKSKKAVAKKADSDSSDSESSSEDEESDVDDEFSDDEEDLSEEDVSDIEKFVKHSWQKRRKPLLHDYARVGFMLSPNPTIMDRVKKETDEMEENRDACERLIAKLFLDNDLPKEEKLKVMNAYLCYC